MIEISEELLAVVLGTTAGEITDALKDGEQLKPQEEIDTFIKTKVDERLYKAKTASRLEGHGRGVKESLTAKEKELKAKLGVEGNTIEEIVDAALLAAKAHSTLNPDDVKNSEVFINETKRLKKLIEDKDVEISSKVQSFAKAETMRIAKEQGVSLLSKLKFVLPENEDIKDENLSNLFEKLENEQTRLSVVDGKIIVLDANGRPKENEAGTKELTFEDHFVAKAKRYFPQAVADGRQSPANKNQDQKTANTDMPEMKSTEDFYTALTAEKDTTKQRAIKAHYEKLVEDGVIT